MPDLFYIDVVGDAGRMNLIRDQIRQWPRNAASMLRLSVVGGMNQMWDWIRTEKWTGGTTAERLARRKGRLLKSLRKTVKLHMTGPERVIEGRLFVAPGSPAATYAAVHEFGAMGARAIRPKTARTLTIPLTREAREKGGPRKWPKGVLFPIKLEPGPGRKGGWFLVRRPGAQVPRSRGFTKRLGGRKLKTAPGRGIIFEYVGKREVEIPPRPAFGPAGDKWFPVIVQTVERDIGTLWERMQGGAGA